jgi:hypothetical protein
VTSAPALPPNGASHYYVRSSASPVEQYNLTQLVNKGKSPFLAKGKQAGDTLDNVNRRMAISTIQGMTADATKLAGLQNIPTQMRPVENGDNRSFFWASGAKGPENYGIVIRPGYIGSPRGLDATIRHEVAHASDTLRYQPKIAHGPTFRGYETSQYRPGVQLQPNYGGDDYTGKNEYADNYSETGDKYKDHVFLSNYDDPRIQPQRVDVKDLKKAIAKNKKAYVANLKNPPAPKLRVGPAVRGL